MLYDIKILLNIINSSKDKCVFLLAPKQELLSFLHKYKTSSSSRLFNYLNKECIGYIIPVSLLRSSGWTQFIRVNWSRTSSLMVICLSSHCKKSCSWTSSSRSLAKKLAKNRLSGLTAEMFRNSHGVKFGTNSKTKKVKNGDFKTGFTIGFSYNINKWPNPLSKSIYIQTYLNQIKPNWLWLASK